MSSEKRTRQKAARAARLEAEWKAAQSAKRRRSLIRFAVIGAIIVLAVVLYNLFTSNGDETVATDSTTTAVATTSTVTPTTATPTTELPAGSSEECPAEDGSSPKTTNFAAPQPLCIDLSEKYVAGFSTTLGSFEVLIDPEIDQASANNFVSLALFHAYDGTIFHRIIPEFVVQGGDVAGLDGAGDPGYKFTGLRPEPGQYRIGSLAMANSGSDPSTNGSQFFVITGPSGVALAPNFSLFGQVISGIEVALEMQSVETGPGDKPVTDLVLDAVTIRVATADDIAEYEAVLAS